jgi:hypothetical protein
MGETAAETVREIEQTRGRLESEIRQLETRLPATARLGKRIVGLAVGSGASGATFWFVMKRIRNRRKEKKIEKVQQPVQTVVQVLPDRWAKVLSDRVEDTEWKQWAAIVGAAWMLFRLAELRQLRRMNKAMLASARPWGPATA